VQVLRSAVASPSDAWLAVRMVSWSLILPALKFALPLPRLVRLMSARRGRSRDEQRERQIAQLSRLLYQARALALSDNCLERSLITYRYLGAAGAEPTLVVGMKPGETVAGHVWLTVDGKPIHERPEWLVGYVPVVSFDAAGKRP
jgi:hypothetical protein